MITRHHSDAVWIKIFMAERYMLYLSKMQEDMPTVLLSGLSLGSYTCSVVRHAYSVCFNQ